MHMTLPNILTLSRVAVIPVFVTLFFLENTTGQWVACGVFSLASITDFFDGYFARARDQLSAFGRFLDPVADKLLVASALMMMVGFGQVAELTIIPAVIILCREIMVSGLREYLAGLSVGLPVSKLAKWKTTIQMVSIGILILGNSAHPVISDAIPVRIIGETGLWVAAVITIITGFDYLRKGLRYMDQPSAADS